MKKKKIRRQPAGEQEVKLVESNKPHHLSIGIAHYQGGIYFGGLKTPAEFSFMSLDYIYESNSWYDFGVSGGYLFNQSQVSSWSLAGYAGIKHKAGPWTFRGGPQLGVAYYREVTPIQNAQAFGTMVGARVQVEYQISQTIHLIGGYHWHHAMFADSFWGKDVFSDVVVDFMGPQMAIGFSF